jgi:hypothetical protein
MNTYKIVAKPDIRMAAHGWPALSKELLSQTIADVAVRELSEDSLGQITVDVGLSRSNHGEALDEIVALVELSGYARIETLATEWISAETQRAAVAAVTFLFGSGVTKNPLVGLAIGAGSTLVAEEAGWVVDRVLAEYTANRDVLGVWTLTRVSRAAARGGAAADIPLRELGIAPASD